MESLKELRRYWFGYGSPVTLGLFRAIFCTLLFINLVMIGQFVGDWYGASGYVPAELGARWLETRTPLSPDASMVINRIDLLFGVRNDSIVYTFYWVTAAAALLTAVGLWTRISSIILAVGVVSLHHRNPIMLHGGDSVMRVCALYLAIGPSGAAVSVDRWLARRRGLAPITPPSISMWPQRLIQYNMAIIYFTTTWAKWFGGLWKEGNATWYPARLHEFDKFPVPYFMNQFPMVNVTTWGTLATEFALATFVWFKPLRKWVLLAGIAMHGWIEYSMNIPLFAFIMVSLYVTFYEGEETADWWDRLKSRFRPTRKLEEA